MEDILDELKNKARELALSGNWNEEAIKLNRKIIEIDGENITAHTRLAKCLIIFNDIDNAILIYKKILTFDPENTIADNQLFRYGANDRINERIFNEKLRQEEEEEKRRIKIFESKNIKPSPNYSYNYNSEYEEPYEDEMDSGRELAELAIHDEMVISYDWSGDGY